jgi:hypothetical protein
MTRRTVRSASVVEFVLGIVRAHRSGESLGGLLAQGPPTPALAHQFVDEQRFVWLTQDDFVNHFAGDVDPVKARALYAVQQTPGDEHLRRRDDCPRVEVPCPRGTCSPKTIRRSRLTPSACSPTAWVPRPPKFPQGMSAGFA